MRVEKGVIMLCWSIRCQVTHFFIKTSDQHESDLITKPTHSFVYYKTEARVANLPTFSSEFTAFSNRVKKMLVQVFIISEGTEI